MGDVRALFCHVSGVPAFPSGHHHDAGLGARCALGLDDAGAAGAACQFAPWLLPQQKTMPPTLRWNPPTRALTPAEAVRMPPLPDSFLERVRALSPLTFLAIPHSLRARHATIAAFLLEGCNAGVEGFDVLEQARTKLLSSPVPKGLHLAYELRTRLDIWEAQQLVSLLERAEAQECQFAASRAVSTGTEARRRAACARPLARGGAYRKAIQAQTCLAAALTPEEESSWAAQLLRRLRAHQEIARFSLCPPTWPTTSRRTSTP